jgi:hypothetical protein
MSKKCVNPPCGKPVPKEREYKSDTCCNTCSYEVKKLNQKKTYKFNRLIILKDRKLEKMLANSYIFQHAGVKLTGALLRAMGFDFGYSTSTTLVEGKIVAMVIGSYAYKLASNDNLTIWKLNSRP